MDSENWTILPALGIAEIDSEHRMILGLMNNLHAQRSKGAKPLALDALSLMGNWLHHHVFEADKLLIPHLVKTTYQTKGG